MIPGLLAVMIPTLVHTAEQFITPTKSIAPSTPAPGHPGQVVQQAVDRAQPADRDLLNREKKTFVMDGLELGWSFLCEFRLIPADVVKERDLFWPLVDQAVEKAVSLLGAP